MMTARSFLAWALVMFVLFGSALGPDNVSGQDPSAGETGADGVAPTDAYPESGSTLPPVEGEAGPQLVEPVDYSGDLWTRPALTGDWGGLRNELSQKGLKFELSVTQVL